MERKLTRSTNTAREQGETPPAEPEADPFLPENRKMTRVAFIHPDLGLGGAERLIVDAAVGLQNRGYDVTIWTGYHDKNHAFPETTNGTLKVNKVGDWIPRHILGMFVAVLSYLRMIFVACYMNVSGYRNGTTPDVVIVDQVSAPIPFAKLPIGGFPKVLFYCHFPDQLLAERVSRIKKFYRYPLDKFEEMTTKFADKIVVNSEFTRQVFVDTFKTIPIVPEVLYPSINSKMFDDVLRTKNQPRIDIPPAKYRFLSINRFEPKKNIELAIRAMRKLRSCLTPEEWSEVHLTIAGGYDPRLQYSVFYLEYLKKVAADEEVEDHITFTTSPKDAQKVKLLSTCTALIYTPSNEHFGIVPLEAMYLGKPVIAINSGGPRETVLNDETGFLCVATETHLAVPMARIVKEPELIARLGKAGKERFMSKFSFETFSRKWDECVQSLIHHDPAFRVD